MIFFCSINFGPLFLLLCMLHFLLYFIFVFLFVILIKLNFVCERLFNLHKIMSDLLTVKSHFDCSPVQLITFGSWCNKLY